MQSIMLTELGWGFFFYLSVYRVSLSRVSENSNMSCRNIFIQLHYSVCYCFSTQSQASLWTASWWWRSTGQLRAVDSIWFPLTVAKNKVIPLAEGTSNFFFFRALESKALVNVPICHFCHFCCNQRNENWHIKTKLRSLKGCSYDREFI